MKSRNFNRRRFISSISMAAISSWIIRPFSSIGNASIETYRSHESLLFYVDANGKKQAVTNVAQWQLKRQQILDSLQLATGTLPHRSGLPALNIKIINEQKEDSYTKLMINFTVAVNETIPAYLYIPAGKNKKEKFPAMIALHPTGAAGKALVDGAGPLPNRAYAKELAQRGYVVIAPDYPGYGDLKEYDFKTDRYESGAMKSIFDTMRCIDLLQSREDVDPARIGVMGHSLGGHSAIFAGAFDSRLKVIVSSCGWTLMDYYNPKPDVTKKDADRLAPWAQELYMPRLREIYDLDPEKIPFDFDEVIAALAPRAFFSNSPENDSNFNVKGVRRGVESVSEVYQFLKAGNNLRVRYPECQHDFPEDVRFEAYDFIDSILGQNTKNKQ